MRRLRKFFKALHPATVAATLAAVAVAALVAGVTTAALGLYNVSARAGHLPGVGWVMHAVFRNSVRLRAGDKAPSAEMTGPGAAALGAGHYEQACSMCHGRPGEPQSATIRAMEPPPPHLSDLAGDWRPGELHWIVYEGIKMTGMPAWPARRSDDVWPLVRFLREVEGLDPAGYARLTGGADRGSCTMCHGKGGRSTNPQVPRLDILTPEYIALSLRAYRDRQRDSGIMAQAASGMPEERIARLARSFPPTPAVSDFPDTSPGATLAAAETKPTIPACRACHGPWPEALNPAFPALSGQQGAYLKQQLHLWRDGPRGGGRMAGLMYEAARDLTDDEIDALANYYAGIPAGARR